MDRLQSLDSNPGSPGSFHQPGVPQKHLMFLCHFTRKGRVPPLISSTMSGSHGNDIRLLPLRYHCHLAAAYLNYGGAGVSKGNNYQHRICAALSRGRLSATPWTAAHQAPLSMGFSGQECWSGLPCPPPGDLPNPGIKPRSPKLQADSLPSKPPRKVKSQS